MSILIFVLELEKCKTSKYMDFSTCWVRLHLRNCFDSTHYDHCIKKNYSQNWLWNKHLVVSRDHGSLLRINILTNNKVMHKSITHVRGLIRTFFFPEIFSEVGYSCSTTTLGNFLLNKWSGIAKFANGCRVSTTSLARRTKKSRVVHVLSC